MPDMFAEAAAMIDDALGTNAVQAVTYWRCSKSVDVNAGVGHTPFDVFDSNTGIATHWQSQDWFIRPADLVIDGETITPDIGDEIEYSGRRYNVVAPAGEPHYRESDPPYGNVFRIHTKLIEL